jgi:hypothetical protein
MVLGHLVRLLVTVDDLALSRFVQAEYNSTLA